MKIICSIGPKVNNKESIDKLIYAGADLLRFNFSHINYSNTYELIKYVKGKHNKISIIQDLAGNKIRVSKNFNHQCKVVEGDSVVFCKEGKEINKKSSENHGKYYIPLSIQGDISLLGSAEKIYMKDGTMEFDIVNKGSDIIETIVTKGGIIRREKGVNVPGIDRSFMGLTEKDKKDIIWGLRRGVDIICLSYACYGDNMRELKEFINKNSFGRRVELWAKVESKEGIDNFEDILKESDGIMIGRGDLISEVDYIDIPRIQKDIIEKVSKTNKKLIIATYVLDSMKRNNKPTLSEINDIYNFVKQGVYGVMLAGEVSIGWNPELTVSTTKKLIKRYL